MKLLVFELRGDIAHFRRPDGIVTHPTYPAMPRTVLCGLIASILGKSVLDGENWMGYSILSPVRTVTQEMSMLGKGWMGNSGDYFNRLTSIQLIVNPHYRVYYAGDHFETLVEMIRERRSVFHTYLGSAFCLTFPRFTGVIDAEEISPAPGDILTAITIVPTNIVERLITETGERYIPMRGARYTVDRDRNFKGTLNFIIEESGRPIKFRTRDSAGSVNYRILKVENGVICLW
ncbi:CRISPR-associated protein Cas5 [Thermosediminibacter oceani]|uniref:CRISPR-associated protein Cas5 n=1 Tax=Thermosediminibacter oceani (strain ATCC BAA-1034 / DSM 16646 / JW/IW-1228P) TaxID=555079 RepID=D9RZG6_THEOJ|nr:CRISPR-associated protein Cas5 [Thermosediminibacter oceani]ADL06864.1 CRISPR-associated protein Cas5 [Thermosediminibacter oceani DSM 16646]